MTSQAWSARYDDCPKCGAKKGEPCRALTSGRVTDTHEARWNRRNASGAE